MKHISCCSCCHTVMMHIQRIYVQLYIASAATLVQSLAPDTHTHTDNNADQEVFPTGSIVKSRVKLDITQIKLQNTTHRSDNAQCIYDSQKHQTDVCYHGNRIFTIHRIIVYFHVCTVLKAQKCIFERCLCPCQEHPSINMVTGMITVSILNKHEYVLCDKILCVCFNIFQAQTSNLRKPPTLGHVTGICTTHWSNDKYMLASVHLGIPVNLAVCPYSAKAMQS